MCGSEKLLGWAVTTAMKESRSILEELAGSEAGRLSRARLGGAAVFCTAPRARGSEADSSSLTGVVLRGYFLPFTGPKEK